MNYDASVVYLSQIPKITVDTGTDWSTIWSFLATIAIFVLGTLLSAWVTRKTFSQQKEIFQETIRAQKESLEKTIASQEAVARQGSLKASRQAWINDLRDVCAEYVAAVMNIQRLNNYWEGAKGAYTKKLLVEPSLAHQMETEWATSHILAMKEAKRLKFKIELLINPEEVDSKQLIMAVNDALNECDKPGNAADEHCDTLVEYCQTILKQEWEKAKAGL